MIVSRLSLERNLAMNQIHQHHFTSSGAEEGRWLVSYSPSYLRISYTVNRARAWLPLAFAGPVFSITCHVVEKCDRKGIPRAAQELCRRDAAFYVHRLHADRQSVEHIC